MSGYTTMNVTANKSVLLLHTTKCHPKVSTIPQGARIPVLQLPTLAKSKMENKQLFILFKKISLI